MQSHWQSFQPYKIFAVNFESKKILNPGIYGSGLFSDLVLVSGGP